MIISNEINNSADQVIEIAKKMESAGINQGNSGNISVRIKGGMLITPSGVSCSNMKSKDLIAMDLKGNVIRNTNQIPSSEWKLHSEILMQRQEINAVLHCHSIHATAIACHSRGIPSFHYMTAIAGGSDIRCAKYATFGTSNLSKNVLAALSNRYACLLAHHGQLTIATTLEKALHIAIEVETLAHMYLKACNLGEPPSLSTEEMERVINQFKRLNYG